MCGTVDVDPNKSGRIEGGVTVEGVGWSQHLNVVWRSSMLDWPWPRCIRFRHTKNAHAVIHPILMRTARPCSDAMPAEMFGRSTCNSQAAKAPVK